MYYHSKCQGKLCLLLEEETRVFFCVVMKDMEDSVKNLFQEVV